MVSFHAFRKVREGVRNTVNLCVVFILIAADLSLIHISEPTRQAEISYAVFCLKKKKKKKTK